MTNMIETQIPYDFIRNRVKLSWSDIKFGLDRQLIKPPVAVERALERAGKSDASRVEIELAGRSETDSVADLVDELASKETKDLREIRAKWLYLVLDWLFYRRQSLRDPLEIVEAVYADFDYPREIAPFVRYMPMVGPDLGNREQNEARLYDYWQRYLSEAARRFSQSS